MKIVTKTLKENHNVSKESDSSLFFRYVWFFLFLVFCVYIFFFSISLVSVRFISIEDEQKWFGAFDDISTELSSDMPESLSERYADIAYTLHIIDMDDTANAFASLGGNLYVTQAFLEQVDYWEELDFIVWHEIGHIEHRDVLKWLISSFPVTILLSFLGGDYGQILFQGVISNTHSKFQESRADRFWIDFAYEKNGHIGCVMNFFEKENTIEGNLMEMFSTHPMTSLRIERAQDYAKEKWYEVGECTPFSL